MIYSIPLYMIQCCRALDGVMVYTYEKIEEQFKLNEKSKIESSLHEKQFQLSFFFCT